MTHGKKQVSGKNFDLDKQIHDRMILLLKVALGILFWPISVMSAAPLYMMYRCDVHKGFKDGCTCGLICAAITATIFGIILTPLVFAVGLIIGLI